MARLQDVTGLEIEGRPTRSMLEIFFILLSMHLTKGKNKTQKAKKPLCNAFSLSIEKYFFDFARNIMGEEALRFFEFLEMCYNKRTNRLIVIIRYANRNGRINCGSYAESCLSTNLKFFFLTRWREGHRVWQ